MKRRSWTLDSGLDHGLDYGLEYGLNSRLIYKPGVGPGAMFGHRRAHSSSWLVSRSQTLYLEKQRGKGLVKLPWQIGSDHATIFEALNWIFETTMGNNLLVWYLVHTQHLKKPVRSEPICHGSLTRPFPSAFRGKGSGYARLAAGRSPQVHGSSTSLVCYIASIGEMLVQCNMLGPALELSMVSAPKLW